MADKKKSSDKAPAKAAPTYSIQPGMEKVTTWATAGKLNPKGNYPELGECTNAQLKEITDKKLSQYVTKLG